MLQNKSIAVVIPCFNEESQIGMVIETMPMFVDFIIIINDCSNDKTASVVESYIEKLGPSDISLVSKKPKSNEFNRAELWLHEKHFEEKKYLTPFDIPNTKENNKVILVNHHRNGGKGAGIATGYWLSRELGIDCVASMDGDGQMDPNELESLCLPIIKNEVDYVKGNRLVHPSASYAIPKVRLIGNAVLSILTKFASGYWSVSDTQTGYTAISYGLLRGIRTNKIYTYYGYPNDILVKANILKARIKEVEIKPVYDVGEKSKMKILKLIPKISWLLYRSFWKRIVLRYFVNDFHPLFVLYLFAHISFVVFICYGVKILSVVHPNVATSVAFVSMGTISLLSLLFAIWMDIQDNEKLISAKR